MKKYILFVLILSSLTFLVIQLLGFMRSDMPTFNLLLSDSATVISSTQIPTGKPTVILFFSPDCEHCQGQTEAILKQIDDFKNVNLYFVTEDPFDRMIVFNKHYHLARYKSIILGRDYNFEFMKNYKISIIPYMVLFNKYKRTQLLIKGNCPIDKLLLHISKL